MPYILVSNILCLLLVMVGDVEPDPGPSRKCPHCQFEIPIRQKKCEHCGLLVKSVKSNQKSLRQNTQYYRKNVVKIVARKVERYSSNLEKQQALSKSILMLLLVLFLTVSWRYMTQSLILKLLNKWQVLQTLTVCTDHIVHVLRAILQGV